MSFAPPVIHISPSGLYVGELCIAIPAEHLARLPPQCGGVVGTAVVGEARAVVDELAIRSVEMWGGISSASMSSKSVKTAAIRPMP